MVDFRDPWAPGATIVRLRLARWQMTLAGQLIYLARALLMGSVGLVQLASRVAPWIDADD